MGWLGVFAPLSWKRAEAEKVVWDKGWPMSSPRRELKEFFLDESIAIKPTKTPLGGIAKQVTPCVDMYFHFEAGRIIIDKAWCNQQQDINCTSKQGEGFKVVSNFFKRGVVEAILQKEADTKKSNLRGRIFAVMADEREAAGLEIPGRRKSKYRDAASPP
jgi:hypothetical protein